MITSLKVDRRKSNVINIDIMEKLTAMSKSIDHGGGSWAWQPHKQSHAPYCCSFKTVKATRRQHRQGVACWPGI